MSQKHEGIEAREAVLRTELAAAIEAHTMAEAYRQIRGILAGGRTVRF